MSSPVVKRVARALIGVALVAAALADAGPAQAAPGAPFPGTVEEFYVAPDPLPPGSPGEIIRFLPVSSAGGSTTARIMYHSRDALDRDRAVTGMVTYPDAPPPPGGWPVLSVAPGTSGMSSQCAASRAGGGVFSYELPVVGVRTDYIGLGPVGETQAYLSRPSEAHSVIDAVRAARNLAATGAGDRYLVLGGSQGGHAAIAANELGESYAPELDLLGTVSLAPAAMFDRVYGPVDEIVTNIVSVMALYGSATEHPEIDPADYVSPATAAAVAASFPTGCIGEIINALVTIPPEDFYDNDPRETEPARSISLANDVGNVAVDSPLLLAVGTDDIRVVIQRSRDLFARLCDSGQRTEYIEYEGATHETVGAVSFVQVQAWLTDRLAGRAPTDTCDEQLPMVTPPAVPPDPGDPGPPTVLPTTPPATPSRAPARFTG